ncbi:MAG: methyltransferase domain-containing protein [Dehalococcoidia bacterium]|nr:methyltransferase domain-containing protein [Dehalococcoidia bacterium]
MTRKMLFDDWPARYDGWFETPIGKAVRTYEAEMIGELLSPEPGEKVLDAGCGTGVFTLDVLAAGARVVGLDISGPMLGIARKKTEGYPFSAIQGDMLCLPFRDGYFDKAVSITALEFIADARSAVDELFRVTRPGGRVVVATLNSLSSWAVRRKIKSQDDEEDVWKSAIFRSPDELLALNPCPGAERTAIHFEQDTDPHRVAEIERSGQSRRLRTGAFVAVRWEKP